MASPGPGSGAPPGDCTPMTTSSCQMPRSMPRATILGQAARRTRCSLFRSIAHRPGAQPLRDLVRKSRHLDGVDLARPDELDAPDLRSPTRCRGHEHDPAPRRTASRTLWVTKM